MRVLLTGAGGFVGPHLARHLLARGDEVAGTYIGAPPDLPGVHLYEADLLDAAAIACAVRRADPEVVVALAGLSHVGESWNRVADYFRVNVLGTENLLRAAAGRRVVLASSSEVYGAVPEERQPIREEEPVQPRTPYALTKAAAERLVVREGGVVVRSFNLIGPGQAATFALPSFALQLADILRGSRGEQEPVLRVGNLSARRDFVHVEDGAAAYRAVAEKGEPGGCYNLASGRALSMEQVLERLMAVAGADVRVEVDPAKLRPVDIPLLQGDPARLRALGWAPEKTVDQALADLWASVC